jgi:AcrR family transcriptional regulator
LRENFKKIKLEELMSPRVEPEERRSEILDAALRCFIRTGYHRTSMDDIVKESGLSKGTIYWYFKNKRALFIALFDRVVFDIAAAMQKVLAEPKPVTERLCLIASSIKISIKIDEESKQTLKLPLVLIAELLHDEAHDEELIQHARSVLSVFATQLKKLIDEGISSGELKKVDSEKLAWGLMALLDGLVLYFAVGITENTTKHLQLMAELIVDGLKKR